MITRNRARRVHSIKQRIQESYIDTRDGSYHMVSLDMASQCINGDTEQDTLDVVINVLQSLKMEERRLPSHVNESTLALEQGFNSSTKEFNAKIERLITELKGD